MKELIVGYQNKLWQTKLIFLITWPASKPQDVVDIMYFTFSKAFNQISQKILTENMAKFCMSCSVYFYWQIHFPREKRTAKDICPFYFITRLT